MLAPGFRNSVYKAAALEAILIVLPPHIAAIRGLYDDVSLLRLSQSFAKTFCYSNFTLPRESQNKTLIGGTKAVPKRILVVKWAHIAKFHCNRLKRVK